MSTHPHIALAEGTTKPGTPDTGDHYIYPHTDNKLYYKADDGLEIELIAGRPRTVTQQTTDATLTTVTTVAVAVDEVWFVKAIVTANIADYSAALGVEMWGVFRRATGGDVTLVGTLVGTVQEDSGSAPTFALTVDTGTQTVDVNVTGVAAETWDWTITLETHQRV